MLCVQERRKEAQRLVREREELRRQQEHLRYEQEKRNNLKRGRDVDQRCVNNTVRSTILGYSGL